MPTRISTPSRSWLSLILFYLSIALVLLVIIGGVFLWRWVHEPGVFPIRHVKVEGDLTHESPSAIEKTLQSGMQGGFFSLQDSAAKQGLLAMPWIARVSFRRVWPDTVTVKIIEQKAVARFGKNGVLNENGDVFYPDSKTIPLNLPDLEGPVDQSKVLFQFYQNINTVAHLIGLSVTALHENAEQSWDLVLSNQTKVILGRQEALPRFNRFVAIYPKIIAISSTPMVSVDLRYPNGLAVQYQNTPKK